MPGLTLISAAALSLAVLGACAQDAFVRQDAASAKRADCTTSARRALHDHGIERGYGPMPVKACNKAAADAGA